MCTAYTARGVAECLLTVIAGKILIMQGVRNSSTPVVSRLFSSRYLASGSLSFLVANRFKLREPVRMQCGNTIV